MSAELPPPPRPDLPREVADASKTPSPWGPLEAIPVFGIALFLLVLGEVIVVRANPGCDLSLTSAPRTCGTAFVLSSLLTELGLLLAVLFWVRVVKRAPIGALGLPGRPL